MSTTEKLPTGQNDLYISPKVVYADLARIYKSKNIYINDVIEWCMQVERDFMADIDTMLHFIEIPLEVSGNAVKMPCNVYRLLDVYEDKDSERPVLYQNNGSYLYDVTDENGTSYDDGTTIYVNFVGMAITKEGDVLVFDSHRPACETYCKIKMFEEDVAMGKFDKQIWAAWNQQFSGQIIAGRSTYRHLSRRQLNDLNIVRGSQVRRIDVIPISQNAIRK